MEEDTSELRVMGTHRAAELGVAHALQVRLTLLLMFIIYELSLFGTITNF